MTKKTTQTSGAAKKEPLWKHKLHEIIFEAETPAGKAFDIALFALIVASVLAVMLESVASIRESYGDALRIAEWGFTILFTIEYGLRLVCLGNPRRYAGSFYGLIDLFSILPTYLSLGFEGAQSLLVVRSFRLLRVFRVLKLVRLSTEAETLWGAIKASRHKISVFLGTVLMLAVIMGTLMYVFEGEANGVYDIPTGIYWAITTISTVGYGDISPHTPIGKFITAVAMILGYGLIAVPTGIVSVELAHAARLSVSTNTCPQCKKEGHDLDALYCRFCSAKL